MDLIEQANQAHLRASNLIIGDRDEEAKIEFLRAADLYALAAKFDSAEMCRECAEAI